MSYKGCHEISHPVVINVLLNFLSSHIVFVIASKNHYEHACHCFDKILNTND